MACCVVPPTDTGEVEVPREDQDMWTWGRSFLSVEDLISLVFLFQWPVADPQYNVTCEEINLYFFLTAEYGK